MSVISSKCVVFQLTVKNFDQLSAIRETPSRPSLEAMRLDSNIYNMWSLHQRLAKVSVRTCRFKTARQSLPKQTLYKVLMMWLQIFGIACVVYSCLNLVRSSDNYERLCQYSSSISKGISGAFDY